MPAVYNIKEGSIHELFQQSRNKLQLIGGGFGNGKTAAIVIKNLQIAREYPGSNLLLGRSTFPRLNDTVRREFLKWCPPKWIKSFPMSQNASNTCTLENGTTLNFRYVQQGGKASGEGTTSNLLSATYDMATIDQIEDPEISEKDFDDILGRLRGNAPHRGDTADMPPTGPRWFLATCNPTANWVFQKLVRPLKVYQETGNILPELFCRRNPENGDALLDSQGNPKLLIDLFEGSTYENAHNLGADFIEGLEAKYRGQFKDRFLLGQWASYEGLVYPEFSEITNAINKTEMLNYLNELFTKRVRVEFIEGFDYGLAAPSAYLLGFTDHLGNVFILDGFYEKEKTIDQLKGMIADVRSRYGVSPDNAVLADPSIFRRTGATSQTVGETIASMLYSGRNSVSVIRGNNDIINGITKITSYIAKSNNHKHPITGDYPASRLYCNNELRFFLDEIGGYYWQLDTANVRVDKPVDRNDHAMDALKYMFSYLPEVAGINPIDPDLPPAWNRGWMQIEDRDTSKAHRYG